VSTLLLKVSSLCIILRKQSTFYLNSVKPFWTLLVHLVFIAFEVNRQFSASFICSWKIPRFLSVTGLQIWGWNLIKFKIILQRIISVVWSTSFSLETWTLTRHDEGSRRLALSVKQSWSGRVQLVSRFTILRIVLLEHLQASNQNLFGKEQLWLSSMRMNQILELFWKNWRSWRILNALNWINQRKAKVGTVSIKLTDRCVRKMADVLDYRLAVMPISFWMMARSFFFQFEPRLFPELPRYSRIFQSFRGFDELHRIT
jgi:hypothetical protein